MILSLVSILFFLVVAAWFGGAETSLLSVSEVRIQTLIRKGNTRAVIVQKLRTNSRRLLGTLLLGQTICDISAASLATLVAHDIYGDWGVPIETGVMTIIVLIFVGIIPKSLAANSRESWALASAKPIQLLTNIFGPIVTMVDVIAGLFIRSKADENVISEEEIKTMTHLGVKSGVVESGEHEMIERVFLFNDITASDVLTPKEIMVSLDGEESLADALSVINSSKFSRFPVYSGAKDNIVGIVNIKDMFERLSEADVDEFSRIPLRDLAKPPIFVVESELIDDLFRLCKKARTHMVLVRDKDQHLVGLVTLEDLLEELVGEISDETDIDEHVIKRLDKRTILVHGDTEIPDVNRFFNTKIPPTEHRTLGRLIMSIAKGTPRAGIQVKIDANTSALIEQVSKRRILRVRLTKQLE
jgi:CBS domain containing-hemolysin-like protein